MKWYLCVFSLLAVTLITACSKNNNKSKVPVIGFQALQPNTVRAGSPEEDVFVLFTVADGDGDLGVDPNGPKFDIYAKDLRFPDSTLKFHFPAIPDDVTDGGKGIEGVCTLQVQTALFLTLRDDRLEGDTTKFEIYIKDKADNESNHITTPDIFLIP